MAPTRPTRTHIIVAFFVIVLFFGAPAWAARTITGTLRVLDGDSVYVGGKEIRLAGIDAPEWSQACRVGTNTKWMAGHKAAAWLRTIAEGKKASCQVKTRDRYKRYVSTCSVGGVNINQAMVSAGWAMAYRRYSKRYIKDEEAARRQKIGIWAGVCQAPWAWRRDKRRTTR